MIKLVNGDIRKSIEGIVVHQVNCMGVMGSGVAKSLRDKYPIIYKEYRDFCAKYGQNNLLGRVQFVKIENNRLVCNMFSQYKYGSGEKHTNNKAFFECCDSINEYCKSRKIRTICMPYKIGCARGGGSWEEILEILEYFFKDNSDVDLTLYKYEE